MNPITWLFIAAPAAVLAALLFLWVYQDNTERGDLMRERQAVEHLEFDRDFANAWNGEQLQAPKQADIDAARAKVAAIEQAKEAREAERCQKLAKLSTELENTIQGTTAAPVNCKEKHQ